MTVEELIVQLTTMPMQSEVWIDTDVAVPAGHIHREHHVGEDVVMIS